MVRAYHTPFFWNLGLEEGSQENLESHFLSIDHDSLRNNTAFAYSYNPNWSINESGIKFDLTMNHYFSEL